MLFNLGNFEAHEFASLLPAPSDDEYNLLREDIRENKLQVPIVLFEDKVLDGRSRLSACNDEGIEPTFVQFQGGDARVYAISENLFRRHLTQSQRAMLIAKYAESKSGKLSLPAGAERYPNGKAAPSAFASDRSIARARVVLRKGHAMVIETVISGQLQLETARKLVVAVADTDRQAKLLSTALERGGDVIDAVDKEIRKYQAEVKLLASPGSEQERRAALAKEIAAIDTRPSARKQAAANRTSSNTKLAESTDDTIELLNRIMADVTRLCDLGLAMLHNRLNRTCPQDPVAAGRAAYERASVEQREKLKEIQESLDLGPE